MVEITEAGYSVSLKPLGPQRLDVSFEFNASKQVILILERELAIADRSLFAKAMELNRKLSFGRLALSNKSGQEKFVLTDRRMYSTAQPKQLARIIRCMLVESVKLSKSGF
jgi:hypothetical protein